jgi:hypothetical protein
MGKGVIDWATIPRTAAKVLSSPREFFEGMPKSGGFLDPFAFMIAMGFAAGVVQLLLKVLGLAPAVGADIALSSVVVMPVTLAAFGFVEAAILHLLWSLMGSTETYETSYRCAAYVSVLLPVAVILETIPLLGGATAVVLGIFFLVAASVSAHRVPSWKAWLVFGSVGGLLVYWIARGAGW